MTIAATNSVTNAASATAATGTTATTTAKASSGTASATSDAADRFLTLLVTQLRNQDPLNPLDNAQLTSQLAQINTVNGINKLNDTVSALAASLAAGQQLQAIGLVGHAVLIPGNKLELVPEKGGAGAFSLPSAATGVTVTIKDSAGAVVRTLKLPEQPAGVGRFAWDGKTEAGGVAKAGSYTFEVVAVGAKGPITAEALAVGTVQGLSAGADGNMQLNLGALGKIGLDQVVELN